MRYKKLGNTNEDISAIGLGTTGVGAYGNFRLATVKERIRLIRHALDLGINYIDTAELYGGGLAEEVVGIALKGIRDQTFVASKFNPTTQGRTGVFQSIEGSLKRLRTDVIDLYQIHWPNPFIPLAEIIEAMAAAVERGMIRHIGVSNFSLKEFREAQHLLGTRSIVSNQLEHNFVERSPREKFLPYCEREDVTLIAYSPLNQGRLVGDENQRELVGRLADKYGRTMSEIVLRWVIERTPTIAVVRTGNRSRLEQNARATDFDFESDDVRLMDDCQVQPEFVALQSIRFNGYRTRFYECVDEALKNRMDFIPSPATLARIMEEGGMVRPIRLTPTTDATGRFKYDFDDYDIKDQVKKYWAWVINHGPDSQIPAFICN